MFTVNQKAVNGENLKKSDYDFAGINMAKTSRLRSYSQFNLEDEVAEEEKAAKFNSSINENYKRLLNFKKEEVNLNNSQAKAITIDRPVVDRLVVDRPAVKIEEVKIDEEELKPSSTTMQFIGMEKDAFELKDKSEEKSNVIFKITTKAKILFCVYTIVILTLFTLIILNTRALKSLDSEIDNMQTQVYVMESEADKLANDLSIVSSEETIKQRAADILGMVESD
jgi:cell division protein FtsL